MWIAHWTEYNEFILFLSVQTIYLQLVTFIIIHCKHVYWHVFIFESIQPPYSNYIVIIYHSNQCVVSSDSARFSQLPFTNYRDNSNTNPLSWPLTHSSSIIIPTPKTNQQLGKRLDIYEDKIKLELFSLLIVTDMTLGYANWQQPIRK